VLGAAALALAAGVVLYALPPGQSPLYPPCLFHAATGLHCPGCGSLRALHALLHGRLAAALGHNPLTVLALPFLACALLARARAALAGRPPPSRAASPAWAWALLALILLFWLLRNIPAWPFTCLAP
jgi:hypothetical protein